MNPGQTERFNCDQCETEFEVTLEPKAKDNPREARDMEGGVVSYYPFCGGDITREDE